MLINKAQMFSSVNKINFGRYSSRPQNNPSGGASCLNSGELPPCPSDKRILTFGKTHYGEGVVGDICRRLDHDLHNISNEEEISEAYRDNIIFYGKEYPEELKEALTRRLKNTNATIFCQYLNFTTLETFEEILNVLNHDVNELHKILTPKDSEMTAPLMFDGEADVSRQIIDRIFEIYKGHDDLLVEMLTKEKENGHANINGVMKYISPNAFGQFLDAFKGDFDKIDEALKIKDGNLRGHTSFMALTDNNCADQIVPKLVKAYEGHYDKLREALKEVKSNGDDDLSVLDRFVRKDVSIFNSIVKIYEGHGEELREMLIRERRQSLTLLDIISAHMTQELFDNLKEVYKGGVKQLRKDIRELRERFLVGFDDDTTTHNLFSSLKKYHPEQYEIIFGGEK